MNSIVDLWNMATSPVHIAFTVLLGLVILYWIIVAIGLLDFDSFHIDVDDGGGHGSDFSFLHFLRLGEVPLMAGLSALILSFWTLNVIASSFLNPNGTWLIAVGIWIPVFLVSMLLTRIITAPIRKVLKYLRSQEESASVKIVGLVCEVTSSAVNPKFGTGSITMSGAPLFLNIRAEITEDLKRGERALIIAEVEEKRIFKVIRYQQPEENKL